MGVEQLGFAKKESSSCAVGLQNTTTATPILFLPRGTTWSATIGGRTLSWGRHTNSEPTGELEGREHSMPAGHANDEPDRPRREKVTSQQKTEEIHS
jgi:hypothetical protein